MTSIPRRPSSHHRIAAFSLLPPTLLQFLLLSMLLHLLVVVLFGTTTSTGARRGDGLLGTLEVTLRRLSEERGSGFVLAPGADTSSPGAALLRRMEGATSAPVSSDRESATPTGAAPPTLPGAPPAAAATAAPPVPAPAAPTPVEAIPSVPDVSLSPLPRETLPELNRLAPAEIDRPIAAPAPPAAHMEPAPAPRREIVLPPMAPIEPIAPARIERQQAPALELRPRETPVAPRAPQIEPVPAPEEPIPPAKPTRDETPPVELAPRDVPVAPPLAPLERVAPARIERQLAPPVEMPAPKLAPVETPAPRLAPVDTPAPAPRIAPTVERDAATPLPRAEPVEIAPGKDRPAVGAPAPGKPAPTPSPARGETPSTELPRLRLGAPSAESVDDDVFRSRRDAPSDAGGTPPVTVDSMRRRAREIAAEGSGSRGVLNLVPPPPPVERKDTLADGIAKAAKPDCRTAYAGMGLLAVVPLVGSTIGNGGCRW